MSKVTEALRKAEEAQAKAGSSHAPPPGGFLSGLREELREEMRQLQGAWGLTARQRQPDRPAGRTDGSPVPATEPAVQQPQRWDQALEALKGHLQASEQRATVLAGERTRLEAQLAANERLAGQLEGKRRALTETLRECQRLSLAVKQAEEDLRAKQEQTQALRFQLSQALAQTDTVLGEV